MKRFLCLFLLFSAHLVGYEYELSVCAIFRDEARFIKEWIEYHKIVGVEHFYLYNNLSKDHYLEVLQPYIESGEVDLVEWPFEHIQQSDWTVYQCGAYMDTIKKRANETKWLAIIDLDEFIVPVENYTITEFLSDYEEYSGVGINWQMYGTSMVYRIPDNELMIENLMMKGPEVCGFTHFVKSIVRPDRVSVCVDPHYCIYNYGHHVDENKEIYYGSIKENVSFSKIRINHYWCRDIHYLENVKWPRHNSYGIGSKCEAILSIGNEMFNQIYDPCIEKYIPALKEAMGFNQ